MNFLTISLEAEICGYTKMEWDQYLKYSQESVGYIAIYTKLTRGTGGAWHSDEWTRSSRVQMRTSPAVYAVGSTAFQR